MPSRRKFIQQLAATGVGLGVLSTTASGSHPSTKPSHVTLTYDQTALQRYRPKLELAPEDRDRLLGVHGWIATSAEYGYDWYVYFSEYSHQSGVTSYDSHLGDREPAYVAVDPDTGEVQRLVYSGYHWLAARASGSTIPLADDTHPALRVINPWHHYTLGAPDQGQYFEVQDLNDVFEPWLQNGLEQDLAFRSVTSPATMRERSNWWQDDVGGLSLTALRVNMALLRGADGADKIDQDRLESTF